MPPLAYSVVPPADILTGLIDGDTGDSWKALAAAWGDEGPLFKGLVETLQGAINTLEWRGVSGSGFKAQFERFSEEVTANIPAVERAAESIQVMLTAYQQTVERISAIADKYELALKEVKKWKGRAVGLAAAEAKIRKLHEDAGSTMELFAERMHAAELMTPFAKPKAIAEYEAPEALWDRAKKVPGKAWNTVTEHPMEILMTGAMVAPMIVDLAKKEPKLPNPPAVPKIGTTNFDGFDPVDLSGLEDFEGAFDSGAQSGSGFDPLASEMMAAGQNAMGAAQGVGPGQEFDAEQGSDSDQSLDLANVPGFLGISPTGSGARVGGAGLLDASKSTMVGRELKAPTGWKQSATEAGEVTAAQKKLAGVAPGRAGGAEGAGAGMMPPMGGMGAAGAGSQVGVAPSRRAKPKRETVVGGDVGTEPFDPDEDDDKWSIFGD